MGLFDEIKKLTNPYDDEDDDFVDEAESEPVEKPVKEKSSNPFAGMRSAPESTSTHAAPSSSRISRREGRVVNFNNPGSSPTNFYYAKPERFEDARMIADHLRAKEPILLNLETTAKDTARRLLDFMSGAAFAQDGKISKIATNTYLITPYGVELMGELLEDFENSGAYI